MIHYLDLSLQHLLESKSLGYLIQVLHVLRASGERALNVRLRTRMRSNHKQRLEDHPSILYHVLQ